MTKWISFKYLVCQGSAKREFFLWFRIRFCNENPDRSFTVVSVGTKIYSIRLTHILIILNRKKRALAEISVSLF